MKKFKLFSILAVCIAALSFASCDTGSDDNSSYQRPTPEQAQLMFQQVMSASTTAGLLMPGDTNNKIEKDSVLVGWRSASAIDSTFTIMNFPVAKLAKYIKDDCVAKDIVAKHDPVTLRGKMVPYLYTSTTNFLFVACPENIVIEGDGKKVTIVFYMSDVYSLAGIATSTLNSKKVFMAYMTPAAVLVDANSTTNITPNQNLKTTMNGYGQSVPFTMFLQANM